MKHLIILMLIVSAVLAQTYTKISSQDGCAIRDIGTVSAESKIVGRLGKAEKDVISVRADWLKIEVMSGSDNVGKTGYIYYKGLNGDKITGAGCQVRDKGAMSGARIFSLKAGAVVKILESNPSWVQIAEGWVYAPLCQLK